MSLTIFITSMSGSKTLSLLLTALSASKDHKARGWCLTRLKGIENSAAFSAREEKKKRGAFLCQRTAIVKSRKQSRPNKLSEN